MGHINIVPVRCEQPDQLFLGHTVSTDQAAAELLQIFYQAHARRKCFAHDCQIVARTLILLDELESKGRLNFFFASGEGVGAALPRPTY